MQPEEVRAALERILPTVEKPGRYVGLERHLVRKDWGSVEVRLLLAFPDEYGIGMSHVGTRILYHLANRRPDTLAERTFAPWPDMGRAMRAAKIPLYSLESYRAVGEFDIVGITLQSELNYTNLPYLFELAQLPPLACQRGEEHPLVVAGGPCVANPEPVAELFDVVAVGDGEVLLPILLDLQREAKRHHWSRRELLERLAAAGGFYVPAFYRWIPGPTPGVGGRFQRLDAAAPERIQRRFVARLEPDHVPELPIVPAVEVAHDRVAVEVARGCTQGCRFCQAGFWYRPVRERHPADIRRLVEAQVEATGQEEVGLLSLSSADYSHIDTLARDLAESLAPRRISVSLPSLRADAFSVSLADSVATVRKAGFTFAPETGSDRLRRVINKSFTNAQMVEAARAAYSRGWDVIKLYAMIGLPSESDADVLQLADLAEAILAASARRRATVRVSVGAFVPKAWTPFQWEAFGPVEALEARLDALRHRFRTSRTLRERARLSWSELRLSALEALLARGDRSLCRVILRAYELGAVFDGWQDCFRPDAWQRACQEHGVDWAAQLGARQLDATLPWDILDAGVRKGYLKAERRRAFTERETPDCRWGRCVHCGIPGDGADIVLASGEAARVTPPAATTTPPAPRQLPQPPFLSRYRFRFAKTGDARWLSHRNVMTLLERALRAAGAPVRYTAGYNPHIRLSMGPAVPVGWESVDEYFDVDCHGPIEPDHLERANRALPPGLELLSCQPLPASAPGLGKAVAACRYRLRSTTLAASFPAAPPAGVAGILAWQLEGDTLRVTLNARPLDGPTPSLRAVLAACGVPAAQLGEVRVLREETLLDRS